VVDKERVAKKVTSQFVANYSDVEHELLRDQKGIRWLISDQYSEALTDQGEERKLKLLAARSLIENGFNTLTKKQNKVMLLAIEGLNDSDIAKFLKIHVTTVREHMKLARKKLKKFIPEFGGDK